MLFPAPPFGFETAMTGNSPPCAMSQQYRIVLATLQRSCCGIAEVNMSQPCRNNIAHVRPAPDRYVQYAISQQACNNIAGGILGRRERVNDATKTCAEHATSRELTVLSLGSGPAKEFTTCRCKGGMRPEYPCVDF